MILISLFFLLVSLGGILYLVIRKIPLLLLVPENLIDESFLNRPSRIKTLARSLIQWYHERKHIHWFLHTSESVLRRVRIVFLKLENILLQLVKRVQEKKEEHLSRKNENYVSELARWKKENGIGKPEQIASEEERNQPVDPT